MIVFFACHQAGRILKICCQNIIRYETHTERGIRQQSGYAVVLHFFYQKGKGCSGNYEGHYYVYDVFHFLEIFAILLEQGLKEGDKFFLSKRLAE